MVCVLRDCKIIVKALKLQKERSRDGVIARRTRFAATIKTYVLIGRDRVLSSYRRQRELYAIHGKAMQE